MPILPGQPEDSREGGRVTLVLLAVGTVLAIAAAAWLSLGRLGPALSPESAPTAAVTPTARLPASKAVGTGTVEVAATVEGSTVLVDGRRLGPAPQRIELAPGSHRVRVEKEGFQEFEREVHVVPGRTLRLEARLAAQLPRLSVEADVPGAQVFLDRKFVGTTPVVVREVSPGSHRLNVSAEGYEMHLETIDVTAGTKEIMVRFKEVRLDEALTVKHKHGLGSCRGRLLATPTGLRYETDHKKDAFSFPLSALEPLDVDYLNENLRLKVRGGKTYNFTADSADDLLAFQKSVEAARQRLP